MDLSGFIAPLLTYHALFFNAGGQGGVEPNDELVVTVDNGITTVVLETIANSTNGYLPASSFNLAEFIELTDNVTIRYETSDFQDSGHLVEAAIDEFLVVETGVISSTSSVVDASIQLNAFPNPFSTEVSITYEIEDFQNAKLNIFNILGQPISSQELSQGGGTISIGNDLASGVYMLQIETSESVSPITKLIKN